jgi:hypothetical protein
MTENCVFYSQRLQLPYRRPKFHSVCYYAAVHFLYDTGELSSSIGILCSLSVRRSKLNTAANSSKRSALTLSRVTSLLYCAMLVTPLSCIPHGTIACRSECVNGSTCVEAT